MTLSELDLQRFGVVTAKARIGEMDELTGALDEFQTLQAQLLIARAPAARLDVIQALEGKGAYLCDCLVYYRRVVRADDPGFSEIIGEHRYRFATAHDAAAVGALAAESFKGYFGHYHADPRIELKKADAVYASWAQRSCEVPGVADRVILCETERDELVGFATLSEDPSANSVEGVLFGVAPAYQGRGVYRDLIGNTVGYAKQRRSGHVVVSTQVTNLAVQRVWIRHAFEPSEYLVTLHLWGDLHAERRQRR